MKLPTCVWITTLAVAALTSSMARRPEAAGAAVLGERTEVVVARGLPARPAAPALSLEEAAAAIRRRLEAQPEVLSVAVRTDKPSTLEIYIRWELFSRAPELKLSTVAAWAGALVGAGTTVVVRDSAGASFRWNGQHVARR